MKLKNVLIAVKDIEKSRRFYHDMFGLEPILDNDGNMILKKMISNHLSGNLKTYIRQQDMSIGLWSIAGDRKWFASMTPMEI